MFYIVKANETILFDKEFKAEGIMMLQSARLDTSSSTGSAAIELVSAPGNTLLQIAFRPYENIITFNHRPLGGMWGPELAIPFQGQFQDILEPSVTIYDHGDRYQILVDYKTVFYFYKRLRENATAVRFIRENSRHPLFAEALGVNVYPSFRHIFPNAKYYEPVRISRKQAEFGRKTLL
ncbi:fungal lectin Cgl3 in complex with Chitotriose [Coprinopsis marcescibilis]|uniref:Galectin n=1 Tax=Coprinopsis marcescibilis TaxID=230819 RepID=A0A5C3KTH8_COPMA|nr:fungal lectin Cgl3 in complex with Chitotriose [Coprinopsis marcescibilis]